MKKYILLQLLRQANTSRKGKRTLMIIAGLGVVTLLIAGAFTIWASVTAASYVVSASKSIVTSEKLDALPAITLDESLLKPGCLSQAQAFLAPSVWLEKPIAMNLELLKTACFQSGSNPACDGTDCDHPAKEHDSIKNGTTI